MADVMIADRAMLECCAIPGGGTSCSLCSVTSLLESFEVVDLRHRGTGNLVLETKVGRGGKGSGTGG